MQDVVQPLVRLEDDQPLPPVGKPLVKPDDGVPHRGRVGGGHRAAAAGTFVPQDGQHRLAGHPGGGGRQQVEQLALSFGPVDQLEHDDLERPVRRDPLELDVEVVADQHPQAVRVEAVQAARRGTRTVSFSAVSVVKVGTDVS